MVILRSRPLSMRLAAAKVEVEEDEDDASLLSAGGEDVVTVEGSLSAARLRVAALIRHAPSSTFHRGACKLITRREEKRARHG